MLTGQRGDDQLYGEGSGQDLRGTGCNRIDAGIEDHYVGARNGATNCGRGRDTARVDRIDRTAGCERVIRG